MKYLLTTLLVLVLVLVLLAAQAAAAPSSGQPPFGKEAPGLAQSPTNIDTQGSGENASASTFDKGSEADAVIDIGENGSTLQIVNGGVKLPDSE